RVPCLDKPDAPGEWTTRQVLCHLFGAPDWRPVARLKGFATPNLPLIEIGPGEIHVTPERLTMTKAQLLDALEAQRREIFSYLESLDEAELGRKARIPLFKQFMGTDEIALPVYVGALFDYHWNDHAGQIGKIRKANGMPAACRRERARVADAVPANNKGGMRAPVDPARASGHGECDPTPNSRPMNPGQRTRRHARARSQRDGYPAGCG